MSEFLIPLPTSIEAPLAMPLDEAIDIVCQKLGLPLLGGPSGKGWSMYSTAQRCPHLYKRTYVERPLGDLLQIGRALLDGELRAPAAPLQVGALYHTLQALYYAHGLGAYICENRGIIRRDLADCNIWDRRHQWEPIPADAADKLLAELYVMAEPVAEDLTAAVEGDASKLRKRPSAVLIHEAERCFDKHTEYYGSREDLEPLAIEWLAFNEELNYSCRYDAIFRLGKNHSLPLPAGSVVVYERKTASWLSEMTREGWWLDGEILGEILNWRPGGCESLFGPLVAVVVDIVTKSKDQKVEQIVIPADLPTVEEHARWLRYTQGEIAQWHATGAYPKRLTQCFDRWGKCGNWDLCRSGDK